MRTKGSNTLYIPGPRLNQLNLLKELAADPHLTQAELARRCHLSVSMVNNYLKELCALGWLEYHRKSTKTVSYHVTAAGNQQLESAQRELLHEMVDLFIGAKQRVLSVILKRTHRRPQRVVLYGSGDLAEIAFHALESAGIDVIGVCDDDPGKLGNEWLGMEMLDPRRIRMMDPDAVILALDPEHSTGEIERKLDCIGERGIDLVRLSCFASQGGAHEPAERDEYQTAAR
jgi:DNA-binding MarR family transcriptional regulator